MSRPDTLLRSAAILVFSALLAACGFQLRGTGAGLEVPTDWLEMHLASSNPNGELSREVTNQFAAQGVNWQERDSANYTLRLGRERVSQRSLSLNAQARAAEIEITMRVQFSVVDNTGTEVIAPVDATIVQQMENDPANIVGKTEEARLIRGEMRVDIAQQMLRRIAFFASAAP
ncbi:MAG: LPS assembly lipoprotein LptE [Pseudomonadota bacterium]